ncbi:hypothetical protein B0H17DRAFT_505888 [Mycena rosella]|uniref:F-box domain-containing protein n=1 Tax=Mycena rosella TaxID=1033263 RepID=A0AAD7DMQ2_MYCRO|nr:hypothetical protein B0H17DRAFT_505888 [Mycena rosella]
MKLHDLNEDVLIKVLSYCDVYTVLCATRVNKHVRAIALAKQLWISLLRDLRSRGLIELAPGEDFQTQTTSHRRGQTYRLRAENMDLVLPSDTEARDCAAV